MEFEVKALVNLAPIIQAYLDLEPLPRSGIAGWYQSCQQWCIKEHRILPSSRQIAEQLKLFGYRRITSKGWTGWAKP